MIQYKIYRIIGNEELGYGGVIKKLIEDDGFSCYDSIGQAFEAIRKMGDDYIEYTVLPVLKMY